MEAKEKRLGGVTKTISGKGGQKKRVKRVRKGKRQEDTVTQFHKVEDGEMRGRKGSKKKKENL